MTAAWLAMVILLCFAGGAAVRIGIGVIQLVVFERRRRRQLRDRTGGPR